LAWAALIAPAPPATVRPIVSKLFETLVVAALLGGWFAVANTAEGVMREADGVAAVAADAASAPVRYAVLAASAPRPQ
jgi:hypothetical protein